MKITIYTSDARKRRRQIATVLWVITAAHIIGGLRVMLGDASGTLAGWVVNTLLIVLLWEVWATTLFVTGPMNEDPHPPKGLRIETVGAKNSRWLR